MASNGKSKIPITFFMFSGIKGTQNWFAGCHANKRTHVHNGPIKSAFALTKKSINKVSRKDFPAFKVYQKGSLPNEYLKLLISGISKK